jgi:hypothetical protein
MATDFENDLASRLACRHLEHEIVHGIVHPIVHKMIWVCTTRTAERKAHVLKFICKNRECPHCRANGAHLYNATLGMPHLSYLYYESVILFAMLEILCCADYYMGVCWNACSYVKLLHGPDS